MEYLNDNRKLLIGLLSASIRGKTYQPLFTTTEWQSVFDEAVKHQVMPLLYPLLAEIGDSIGISKVMLEKWHENALCQGVVQERGYFGVSKVLERLTNEDIPVIALKGMVLRELYPHPSLRTMGDVDLLVKPGDVEKARGVLVNSGYIMHLNEGKHIEYSHIVLPGVELHRSMVADGWYGNYTNFETEIWGRSKPINISNSQVLSLCPQDKVLYLTMHMASHIISSGFGLRQLSDFVLFIEAHRSEIDWIEFFRMAALFHIDAFLKVLLEGCHIMFNLELPKICKEYETQDVTLVRSFIEDIFEGGVFGANSNDRIIANILLYYNDGSEAIGFRQKLKGFMNLVLPKTSKLDSRFNYARKYHLLLPVAWIHRIFYTLLRKDLDFALKTSILTSRTTIDIYNNRRSMLRKLGLLD